MYPLHHQPSQSMVGCLPNYLLVTWEFGCQSVDEQLLHLLIGLRHQIDIARFLQNRFALVVATGDDLWRESQTQQGLIQLVEMKEIIDLHQKAMLFDVYLAGLFHQLQYGVIKYIQFSL